MASSDEEKEKAKKKRPRKRVTVSNTKGKAHNQNSGNRFRGKDVERKRTTKEDPSDKEIQEKIKATLAKLSGSGKESGRTSRAKI